MKKLFLIVLAFSFLFISSCGIQKHVSFGAVHIPSSPNDTISVEGSFWGFKDLVSANLAADNRFNVFVKEATKNCDIAVTKFPTNLNDTITVRLTCDSLSDQSLKYFSGIRK